MTVQEVATPVKAGPTVEELNAAHEEIARLAEALCHRETEGRQLQQQLAELASASEQKLAQLTAEHEQAKGGLLAEVARLSAALAAAESEAVDLKQQLSSSDAAYQEKVAQMTAEFEKTQLDLAGEIARQAQALNGREDDVRTLQQQLAELSGNRDASTAQLSEQLEKVKQELSAEVSKLTAALAARDEDVSAIKQQLSEANLGHDLKVLQLNEGFESTKVELTRELAALAEQLKARDADIKQWELKASDAAIAHEQALAQLQTELAQLKDDVAQKDGVLDELELALSVTRNKAATYVGDSHALVAKVAELHQQIQAKDALLFEAENSAENVKALSEEVAALTDEVASLRESLDAKSNELQTVSAKYEQLYADTSKRRLSHVEMLEADVDELQQTAHSKSVEAATALAALDVLKSSTNAQIQALQQEIVELKEQLSGAQRELVESAVKYAADLEQARHDALNESSSSADGEIVALKDQLAAKDAELQKLHVSMETLKSVNQASSIRYASEIARLQADLELAREVSQQIKSTVSGGSVDGDSSPRKPRLPHTGSRHSSVIDDDGDVDFGSSGDEAIEDLMREKAADASAASAKPQRSGDIGELAGTLEIAVESARNDFVAMKDAKDREITGLLDTIAALTAELQAVKGNAAPVHDFEAVKREKDMLQSR